MITNRMIAAAIVRNIAAIVAILLAMAGKVVEVIGTVCCQTAVIAIQEFE